MITYGRQEQLNTNKPKDQGLAVVQAPPTHPQLAVSLLPALKIQQEMLFVLISVMVACILEELLKPETPSVKAITPAEQKYSQQTESLSEAPNMIHT